MPHAKRQAETMRMAVLRIRRDQTDFFPKRYKLIFFNSGNG